MTGKLIQVVFLITDTLALFLTVLLLARFFMQVFRVPFGNRAGELVMHLTDWLVIPLRKILPPVRGFDTASLLPAYLLQVLRLALVIVLGPGLGTISPESVALQIAVNGLLSLLQVGIYLFILLLFIQVIISWFKPEILRSHPVSLLTEPLLRPLRKVIPPISGIDLTPLVAFLLAQIVLIFL